MISARILNRAAVLLAAISLAVPASAGGWGGWGDGWHGGDWGWHFGWGGPGFEFVFPTVGFYGAPYYPPPPPPPQTAYVQPADPPYPPQAAYSQPADPQYPRQAAYARPADPPSLPRTAYVQSPPRTAYVQPSYPPTQQAEVGTGALTPQIVHKRLRHNVLHRQSCHSELFNVEKKRLEVRYCELRP
jgi:hypothetical protein